MAKADKNHLCICLSKTRNQTCAAQSRKIFNFLLPSCMVLESTRSIFPPLPHPILPTPQASVHSIAFPPLFPNSPPPSMPHVEKRTVTYGFSFLPPLLLRPAQKLPPKRKNWEGEGGGGGGHRVPRVGRDLHGGGDGRRETLLSGFSFSLRPLFGPGQKTAGEKEKDEKLLPSFSPPPLLSILFPSFRFFPPAARDTQYLLFVD